MKLPVSTHIDSEDVTTEFGSVTSMPVRYHRRVDLIFAPVGVYWCAVVGWCVSI